MKRDNINIGNAGEYFVAGELERRGFSVAVPMSNVPLFDLLAIDRKTKKQIAIQVKTAYGSNADWMMSKKNEKIIADNIFYAFVLLNKTSAPHYYIVPSKTVAQYIYEKHQEWIQTPGKKGQPHNDTPMRKFSVSDGQYLDKWELLMQ